MLDAKRELSTAQALTNETGQVANVIADASATTVREKDLEIKHHEQRAKDLSDQLHAEKQETKEAERTAKHLAGRGSR